MAKRHVKITCTYVHRGTGCPAGHQVFIGKDINEASILAANYQSAHPNLIEKSCECCKTCI